MKTHLPLGKTVWWVSVFAGPVLTVPQMYQVFVVREVEGVSFVSWFSYGVICLAWIWHSYRKDWGVFWNSLIYAVQCFLIAIGVLIFA